MKFAKNHQENVSNGVHATSIFLKNPRWNMLRQTAIEHDEPEADRLLTDAERSACDMATD